MNDTGSGNELVRRVGAEVEPRRSARNIQADRPYMQTAQYPDNLPIIKINVNPPQLIELGDLPEHNRGYGPPVSLQQHALGGPKVSAHGKQ